VITKAAAKGVEEHAREERPLVLVDDALEDAILARAEFGANLFDPLGLLAIHNSLFKYGSFITALITFVAIAAAVFFFVVKPYEMVTARRKATEEAVPSDEERRHQELLTAINNINR
jgi:large conductance mechanosensitive channel